MTAGPHAAANRGAGVKHDPYPCYRDSGVAWLGEVPEHWEVKRLEHVASYRTSSVDKRTEDGELPVRLCNYTDVYYQDRIRASSSEFMEATASAREIARFKLCVGDVLITKDSEDWQDVAVPALIDETAEDFLCGYHLGIIRPGPTMHPAFMLRALQSVAVNRQLQTSASGVTRYGLPNAAVTEALVPLPPLDEQRTIAAFLDRETERIDALVAKKRLLIERLQEYRTALITRTVTRGLPPEAAHAAGLDPSPHLKPSGVEWLGAVPEHWEVRRLSSVIDCLDGKRIPLNGEERADRQGDYPYWGANGVLDHLDDWLFDEQLVLLGEDGAPFFAQNKRVAFSVSGRIWVNNHAHVLRPTGVQQEFLTHLLNITEYAAFIDGSTRNKLTQGAMNGIPVLLPPAEEQVAIVQHLRGGVSNLELLAGEVHRAVDRLQEYRTALITAAVTGKIDVRESARAQLAAN